MSETVEPFKVDSLDKAAWAMRKYRQAAQRKARNVELADAEHERIQTWLESANKRHEDAMAFFAGHLEGFARQERLEGRKSVSLPDGEVKSRAKSWTLDVEKDTFVAWAKDDHPDLLRVSYAPDMAALKERLAVAGPTVVDPDTGEAVPGITVIPETVSYVIAPSLDVVDLGEDDDVEE